MSKNASHLLSPKDPELVLLHVKDDTLLVFAGHQKLHSQTQGVEAPSYPLLDLDSKPLPVVCIAASAARNALLYLKATRERENLMV